MSIFEVHSSGDRRSLIQRFTNKSKADAVSQLVDIHLAHCKRIEQMEGLMKDMIAMIRAPESGMRSECLRIDAVRAEQLLGVIAPDSDQEPEGFKDRVHAQGVFRLNVDTLAAAKWGWHAAVAALAMRKARSKKS